MAKHHPGHRRHLFRTFCGTLRGATHRPLASIAASIRALAGGEKDTSIPATDVHNEIGDIARAAEVFRRTLVDADAAREEGGHALAGRRLAGERDCKLVGGA